ncbi:Calmodulin-binding transcription activator 4 [Acorus calamus]|uniref:Calmodulin-binding transcription activator 4 n=1 Tax=Acorus calamus TaxID=4465 RepID=A0AAV9CX85_ACOCL|nr:Calmodulin-binding transcription activator 4 [Acorus calamus]
METWESHCKVMVIVDILDGVNLPSTMKWFCKFGEVEVPVHQEDNKLNVLDEEGQGIIHLLAALGYEWAMRPLVAAGANPNFRDARGWTALHWAAVMAGEKKDMRGLTYHTFVFECQSIREETVVTLIRLGAAPDALDDSMSEFPKGITASDLASFKGHEGIARYLAEILEKTVIDDGVSSTPAADKSMVSRQSCYHVIGIHRYFWECQKELVKCRDENSVIRCVETLVASLNKVGNTGCSIDPLCCSCQKPDKHKSLKDHNRIVNNSGDSNVHAKVPFKTHIKRGLDTQNEKQIPMQSGVDLSGASSSQVPFIRIYECTPECGFPDVETMVVLHVDVLGSVNHPSTVKWFCMFGEVGVPVELLSSHILRCYAPPHAPREETVVSLIRLGSAPDALDDPTSEFPEGRTASDLASIKGHEGIARYLAETLEKTIMDDGVSSTPDTDKSMVSQQSCYHVIGVHRYFWECQKELGKCRDENSVIRCVETLVASLNKVENTGFIDPLRCSCQKPEKHRSLKDPNRIVKNSDDFISAVLQIDGTGNTSSEDQNRKGNNNVD